MKTCSYCCCNKPLTAFYTSASVGSGGFQSRCKECCKETAKDWSLKNIEKRRAYKNAYERAKRRERGLKSVHRTKQEFATKHRDQERQRYKNNTVQIKARIKKWKQDNPHRVSQSGAKRKAAKLGATPSWANTFFLSEAYALAALRSIVTGYKWHVDHVVPLQHETVCGLHNEFNVQVIPASVNCSKQNRYWPDMPTHNLAQDVLA